MTRIRLWPPAIGGVAALVAVALCLTLSGCAALQRLVPPSFDTETLNGTTVKMDMPVVDGNRPFITVNASVGGGPSIALLVDTGSPGVRVFADRAGTSGVTQTQNPVDVTFADGTRFAGVEASAPVTFGGLETNGPINVQLITAVSCGDGKPECAGSGGIEKFAQAQAFAGILGIGMQASDIYSPISQLKSGSPKSFSIAANSTVGSATMTFNTQPPAPLAAFPIPQWTDPQLPNGYPAWASNQVQACWAYAAAATSCVPTSFDTGSPTLFTDRSIPGGPKLTGPVTPGTTLALSAQPGGPPIWSVNAGNTPGKNTVQVQSLEGGSSVNSGISIFRSRLVTFDLQNGNVLVSQAG